MKLFLSLVPLLGCGTLSAATTIFKDSVLLSYGATPGNEFAPTVVAGGLSGSSLVLGSSAAILEAGAALPGTVFLNPTIASPAAADSFSNQQYFEFSISSPDGLLFQPLTLSFLAANGGASSPRGWSLHSSLDGFASALASSDVGSVQPAMQDFTVSLSGFATGAEEITFRIYGYSPGEGEGLFFDEIELAGRIESSLRPRFHPELLLEAASATVHGARTFHRELESQSLGREIVSGDCFQAWGLSGVDWFGGGAGESYRASGGLPFRLPYRLVGQVAGSLESVRGAPIDTDTARLGFALDNGAASGLQWLVYLGGFSSTLESSRSGDYALGSSLMELDTEGWGLQAEVAAGWWLRHGAITWGPTVAVEYATMEVKDAAYWGAPVAAGVALDDVDSLRTLVGVRAAHDPIWKVQPFAALNLATEWSGADSGILATAVGSRPVQDPDGRGTSAILQAGISVPVWQGASASFSYLGELPLSGGGVESHGFRVGLEASF